MNYSDDISTLVMCPFKNDPSEVIDNLVYRPSMGASLKSIKQWKDILVAHKPEVLVVGSETSIPTEARNYWNAILKSEGKEELRIVTRGRHITSASPEEKLAKSIKQVENISSTVTEKEKDEAALIEVATIALQKIYQNTFNSLLTSNLPMHQKCRSITLVGAGIESLLSGLLLQQKGYDITFVEKAADYRNSNFSRKATTTLSVKSEGRHLSVEESTPFNATRKQRFSLDKASQDGWVAKSSPSHTPEELEWQNAFHKIAAERPGFFKRASELNTIINKLGMKWWDEVTQDPRVLKDVSIHRKMYRLFAQPKSVKSKHYYPVNDEKAIKALSNESYRELSKTDISSLFPGLTSIVDGIEVDGSSIDITKLTHNIATILEEKGAKFMWQTKIKGIKKNSKNEVSGLIAEDINGNEKTIVSDDSP